MNEPIFLSLEQVRQIHKRSLAEHGGSDGTRDLGMVESALVFLAMNSVYAQPPKWELYLAVIDVATKKKTKMDLAAVFRKSVA